ncbi:MAG: ribosome silencing factor [Rubripirellula sp.]|jgi:ribosome-associated protein|nr:ribosome silencing factor [Rubripirellula sp.]
MNEPDSPESEEQPVESVAEPKPSSPAEDNPMATASRSIRPHGLADGLKLATAAARVALDNKASDVAVLDVSAQSAEFDFFVLGTGTSRRQLHAISEQIDDELEKVLGDHRMGIEGYDESRWIVLDYGSVVIHLFDDETREYYDLESLWADAKLVPLADLGLSSSDA